MAQNKKPKVDFSTALKAKAEELAPKPTQADPDEEFLANINGEDVRFVRGDSTDAEWAAIKARPAAVQRVTVKPVPGSGSPASTALATRKQGEPDAEWRGRAMNAEKHPRYDGTVETSEADQKDAKREQYKALIQNEAYSGGDPASGALVTAEELKMLRAMNPDTAADFIDERIKKRAIVDEEKNKPKPAPVPNATPSPDGERAPNEDKFDNMQPEASNTPNVRNPASFIPSIATGATGSPMLDDVQEKVAPMEGGFPGASNPAPMTGGFPGLGNGDPGVAQANAKGDATGAADLATLKSASEAVNPLNLARRFDNAVTGALKPLNDSFTGRDRMSPADLDAQEALAKRDPGVEFDPALDSPAPVQDALAHPVTPSMGPGNVSASLGVKVPGGFKSAQEDPKFAENLDAGIAASKARASELADLQAANEVVQDGIVRESGKRRLEAEAQMQQEASLASQARLNAVTEAQRYTGAKTAALEAARQAAQTPTDPNRYWNNKDAGQKAAAVIAGALFGFTGQGMNWLQRIDGLIEADMRVQVADRSSKVQGLEGQARGMGEAADFAMRAGASEAEAHILARQMKLESLNSYLQQQVARSQNMQQKVVGQQMLMELQNKMVGLDNMALDANSQSVARKNQTLYQNATLAQGAAELRIKSGADGAGSGLKPGEIAKLDEARQGYDAVTKLKQLLGPESSVGGALYDEVTSKAGQLSEAGRRKKSVEPFRRALIRLIDASAIQKADQEFWKDKISNVGLDNMSQSDLDGLQELFSTQYNAVVETHQSGLRPLTPPAKALKTERPAR